MVYCKRLLSGCLTALAVPALGLLCFGQEADRQEDQEALREIEHLKKIYGREFEDGGKEWLAWKHQFDKTFGGIDELNITGGKPSEGTVRRDIVTAATFTVPSLMQIDNFCVTTDRVIASIRYYDGKPPSHLEEWTIEQIKSALVAWDLAGNFLWETEMPWGCHLLVVDDNLLVAHNGGDEHPSPEIVWIDPKNGNALRRVQIPGMISALVYHKTSKLFVMISLPKERLVSLDGGMEVRAYRMSGDLAWKHRESSPDLYGFSLAGPAIVIGSFTNKGFVAGLDADSGRELWRRAGVCFPAPPEGGIDNLPKSHEGLACIPKHEGFEFVEPRSGKVLHAIPREGQLQTGLLGIGGSPDRLYWTSPSAVKGINLIVVQFPTRKALWADRTGTILSGAPAAWGPNEVFLGYRYGEVTGRLVLTELRIYSRDGTLLFQSTTEEGNEQPEHWGTLQTTDRYLYAVKGNKLCAFEWKDANK